MRSLSKKTKLTDHKVETPKDLEKRKPTARAMSRKPMEKIFTEEQSSAFFSYVLNKVEQRKIEHSKPVGTADDDFLDLQATEHTHNEEMKTSGRRLEIDFNKLDENSQREVRKIISNMRYLDRVSSSRKS